MRVFFCLQTSYLISYSGKSNQLKWKLFVEKKAIVYTHDFSKFYYAISINKRIAGFFLNKNNISNFCKIFENNFDNSTQSLSSSKKKEKKISFFLEQINCKIETIRKLKNGTILIVALYYFTRYVVQFFRIRCYFLHPYDFSYQISFITSMEICKIILKENKSYFLYQKYLEIYQMYKVYKITKFNNCTVFWKKKNIKNTFEGYLVEKGCSVFIDIFLCFLHVNDDLILSDKILFINDKGFNEDQIIRYGIFLKLFFHLNKKIEGEWSNLFSL